MRPPGRSASATAQPWYSGIQTPQRVQPRWGNDAHRTLGPLLHRERGQPERLVPLVLHWFSLSSLDAKLWRQVHREDIGRQVEQHDTHREDENHAFNQWQVT